MSVTYDCTCEACGVKVGEATFPSALPDDIRIRTCERGMLCEVCAAVASADPPTNEEGPAAETPGEG